MQVVAVDLSEEIQAQAAETDVEEDKEEGAERQIGCLPSNIEKQSLGPVDPIPENIVMEDKMTSEQKASQQDLVDQTEQPESANDENKAEIQASPQLTLSLQRSASKGPPGICYDVPVPKTHNSAMKHMQRRSSGLENDNTIAEGNKN